MADFVTMVNGLCGIMSIFNSLAFCLSHPSDYTYLWKALAFPYAGLFADFFDGKVARWRGKSSLLGQELDSLADLVPPLSLSLSSFMLYPIHPRRSCPLFFRALIQSHSSTLLMS